MTPELEELFGVPAGSFEGTYDAWAERVHPDDRAGVRQLLQRWMACGSGDERWEHRILRPDGEVRWIEARGRLYRADVGRAVRIVGTGIDITDRKRMEEVLRERERDLERSNSDLQAYAYTVSHDLQEPLRAIACYAQMLDRECGPHLDEACRSHISLVTSGAQRMRALIGGLLEFSRVGQDNCPMSAVDCNSVLREVIDSLSVKIEETGARISTGPLPTVQAWDGRLHQLFQNLIGNALKYCKPEVAPEIGISAELRGELWHFAVKDNGIGFDMKDAEKIFGVFKRLHTREYEGLGIGLSICKRIVEYHGGRIWVESAPGEGALFGFTVPARTALAAHAVSSN